MKSIKLLSTLFFFVCLVGVQNNAFTQCNASFTYTINGNLEAIFTNTSTGSYTTSFWNFDNGNTSSLTNPIDTFINNGSYNVCLTVSDSLCTSTFCDTIVVTTGNPCYANFATSINGLTLNLTPYSTSDNGAIKNYWDFGDGNTSITTLNDTLSHNYAAPGTYTVSLAMNDTISWCGDTLYQTVTISAPCGAVANYSFTYGSNGDVNFTSLSTGSFTSEDWSFGDGTPPDSSSNPTHNFLLNGTYQVCLTAIDSNQGCTVTYCDTVTVTNAIGNVCTSFNAGFTYTDNGNGNFQFNDNSTGLPTDFTWNFGDGNQSTVTNPNHTYTNNGTYVVSLNIYDSLTNCQDYYFYTISVSGATGGPQCNASFVIVPDSASPSNVIVYNTATGSNLTYFWNFGDGNTSTLQYPNYTYATNGPFQICLTVDDGSGCNDTYCDSISAGGLVYKSAGFSMATLAPVLTSIENNELTSHVNAYPNPFKNSITIELNLSEQGPVQIFISNLLGEKVNTIANRDMNVGVNKLQWDAEDIPNGIYLLNIKTNNATHVKKLILSK